MALLWVGVGAFIVGAGCCLLNRLIWWPIITQLERDLSRCEEMLAAERDRLTAERDAAIKRIESLEAVCDEAADDIEADRCDHATAILRYALESRAAAGLDAMEGV